MPGEYNCSYSPVNNCGCFTCDFISGISSIMEYGDRIVAARTYAGMSQSELAEAAKTSQANVSKLESGKAKGSQFTAQFAAACNVNPLWLATGEGEMVTTHFHSGNEKIDQAVKLMQELPEYALDEAIKSIDSVAKLTKYNEKKPRRMM
jgi:transcriptional regulator with XRE-family HTH domain